MLKKLILFVFSLIVILVFISMNSKANTDITKLIPLKLVEVDFGFETNSMKFDDKGRIWFK